MLKAIFILLQIANEANYSLFQDSFNRSCKIIGRALNEDIDIFINYTKDPYEKAVASDDLLHLAQVYHDDTWTAKRLVTGMAFSEHHPDLLAVSYGVSSKFEYFIVY